MKNKELKQISQITNNLTIGGVVRIEYNFMKDILTAHYYRINGYHEPVDRWRVLTLFVYQPQTIEQLTNFIESEMRHHNPIAIYKRLSSMRQPELQRLWAAACEDRGIHTPIEIDELTRWLASKSLKEWRQMLFRV